MTTNIVRILFISFLISSGFARVAFDELNRYNANGIKNNDDKLDVIKLINGNARSVGLDYEHYATGKDFETIVNAAQQTVMVNGARYDWFGDELVYSMTNTIPAWKTGKNFHFRSMLEKTFGKNNWKTKNFNDWQNRDQQLPTEERKAEKFREHIVQYYIMNVFLQHKNFSYAYVSNDPLVIARNIYNKINKFKFTKDYYKNQNVNEDLQEIVEFGNYVLATARDQDSPVDYGKVKIEDESSHLVDITGFGGYTLEHNPEIGESQLARKVRFSSHDKQEDINVLGIDYNSTKIEQLPTGELNITNLSHNLSRSGMHYVKYKVDDAIKEIYQKWGKVSSIYYLDALPFKHLFWVQDGKWNTKNAPDPEHGVLYGYVDQERLPQGLKNSLRVGNLMQLSKSPQNADMSIINKRAMALSDKIGNWRGEIYPIQNIGLRVQELAKKETALNSVKKNITQLSYNIKNMLRKFDQSVLEINKIDNVFNTLSSIDYRVKPLFSLFDYTTKGDEPSRQNNPEIDLQIVDHIYTGKGLTAQLVQPKRKIKIQYFTDAMAEDFFNKNLDASYYLIRDDRHFYAGTGPFDAKVDRRWNKLSLKNEKIAQMYDNLFNTVFRNHIAYMVVYDKPNSEARLYQATPGVPTPRMVKKLKTFIKLIESEGWKVNPVIYTQAFDGVYKTFEETYNKGWDDAPDYNKSLDRLKEYYQISTTK